MLTHIRNHRDCNSIYRACLSLCQTESLCWEKGTQDTICNPEAMPNWLQLVNKKISFRPQSLSGVTSHSWVQAHVNTDGQQETNLMSSLEFLCLIIFWQGIFLFLVLCVLCISIMSSSFVFLGDSFENKWRNVCFYKKQNKNNTIQK